MKVRCRFPEGGPYPRNFFRIEKNVSGRLEVTNDLTTLVGEVASTYQEQGEAWAIVVYDQAITTANGQSLYHLKFPWWALKPAEAE